MIIGISIKTVVLDGDMYYLFTVCTAAIQYCWHRFKKIQDNLYTKYETSAALVTQNMTQE